MKVKSQSGFTIVELLIVVIVIAILATITIVSFNNITERARVSSASSFASQLKRAHLAEAQGYWSFDECSGSTIGNSGGSAAGGNATVSGTVSWSTDTPTGTGCSLSFNGSTSLSTGIILPELTYYRKSAWIKTSAQATTGQNIISGGNTAFYLTGARMSAGHNSQWTAVQNATLLNDGKWHFVSLEYSRPNTTSNGTLTLTLDGAQAGVSTNIAPINNTGNSEQTIGSINGSSLFSGLIDEPMIVWR